MTDPSSPTAVRFVASADDAGGDAVAIVLDTTWTAPPPGDGGGTTVAVRDIAERILAHRSLMSEALAHLDRWAAASGAVERLTIRDTSFWYYVRLRHDLWLQERILWAAIVDAIVREYRPAVIHHPADAEPALLDVLTLRAATDGIALRRDPGGAAAADEPVPAARERRLTPARIARGLARRLLRAFRVRQRPGSGDPPTERAATIAARRARVAAHVEALAAGPAGRLLVVHEHARQQIDTAEGTRSINAYLDPIVDRLRGTPLDPVILDIRARLADDAAWARLGSGDDERLLPVDALALDQRSQPTPAAARAAADAASLTASLAAWRAATNVPIPVDGVDLGPLLAAEVAGNAARWLPGMHQAVDRIGRFLERLRPAGVLLADEYHRQDWLAAAGSLGIPVAAVQHGIIFPHHTGYIHAARPAGLRLVQRLYVFGRWERDLLRSASVFRDDEVVVGGSPRLDLVRHEPGGREALRNELGIAQGERMVVVSGTWGGLARQFHYPIALARLVDRPLPGVHLVVKLHPGEPDEGPYRRVVEGSAAARGFVPPPITVVQAIDLYRLLAAADAHLGIQSTVLTEAVVTRTPNLLADVLAAGDLLGYVAAGVATPVRNGADLLAALDGAAVHQTEEAARAFTELHFEPGSAGDRIAADLLAWLSGTGR